MGIAGVRPDTLTCELALGHAGLGSPMTSGLAAWGAVNNGSCVSQVAFACTLGSTVQCSLRTLLRRHFVGLEVVERTEEPAHEPHSQ